MEQKTQTLGEHLESQLPPAQQSQLTGILNGTGNGAMVGLAVAYGAQRLFKLATKKPTPNFENINTFGSVAGAAIGSVFGLHETKQIEQYRTSLRTEVERLHQRMNSANDKIAELSAQLQAKEQAAPAR